MEVCAVEFHEGLKRNITAFRKTTVPCGVIVDEVGVLVMRNCFCGSTLALQIGAGYRIGRWTLIRLVDGPRPTWECRCDCGEVRRVPQRSLVHCVSGSCGCHRSELLTHRLTTHAQTKSAEYGIWRSMIQRCTNPARPGWHRYGGRGITVCSAWLHSFESFLRDVGQRPAPEYSLDRIDSDGNYEPGNVRWATRFEQARNRANNTLVTIRGVTACIAEWSEISGVDHRMISNRLRS